MPAESPTLGFTHLQFEALLTAARKSPHPCDFALVAMLGLLGLRIFEATSADIADLGEEHGHRVLRVCGKGAKIVLVPLPPAVGRAIDRAVAYRTHGPVLLNCRGSRMDRHAATRRLRRLAASAGIQAARAHPHMLRHTFVTTMLDAGVDLRHVQIAARHADPCTTMRYDRARQNLDRHPNYILAAFMASGTSPTYASPAARPGRRTTLPNTGRCVVAYLCAGLDAVGGCSDVNSDLSCNGNTPNAHSVLSLDDAVSETGQHRTFCMRDAGPPGTSALMPLTLARMCASLNSSAITYRQSGKPGSPPIWVLLAGILLSRVFRAAHQRLDRLRHGFGVLHLGGEQLFGEVVGAGDELPGLG